MDEAANQIAFADTILLNKIDLVSPEDLVKAREMVRAVNMTANLMECQLSGNDEQARPSWDTLMNVNSFSIERALQVCRRPALRHLWCFQIHIKNLQIPIALVVR